MFGSFSRSYDLVRTSWNVLRQDKEIMIFPVVSAVASLAAAATFLTPVILTGLHMSGGTTPGGSGTRAEFAFQAAEYAWLFAFYVASWFITVFFNVGVMTCAAKRMDGGDPTVADGFRGAFAHILPILAWSLVSATVGVVLRAIEERASILGQIAAALIGLAWSFLTYFAVPVIIFENAGIGRAISRSGELFKRTWGEAVVGETGMGLFFGLLAMIGILPVLAAVVLCVQGAIALPAAIAIGSIAVVYWIALAVVSAALQGIFHVALYRYASTGQVPHEFPQELVAGHWRPKTAGGLWR
jgi:hypothetical protein